MIKCIDCKHKIVMKRKRMDTKTSFACPRLSDEMVKEDGTICIGNCAGYHTINVTDDFGCIYFEIGV